MEKSIWWEEFVNSIRQFGKKEFVQVIKNIEDLDNNETEEGVLKVKKEVGCLRNILNELNDQEKDRLKKIMQLDDDYIDLIIEKYNRKIRIFENRVNREISENFGLMLLHYRNKLGLSLKALSEMTGISPSYINRMEKGERKAPSIKIIEALAKALCVDKSILIDIANLEAQDEFNTMDIEELFLKSNLVINSKTIGRKEKELLSKIITKVTTSEWSSRTKHIESLEIIDLINQFKTI